jgi:hypothetical protein
MDYFRKITGIILVLIGIFILIYMKLDGLIGSLIFILFGIIIFFNKSENEIEQMKGDKK